jgi:hypothetical protein
VRAARPAAVAGGRRRARGRGGAGPPSRRGGAVALEGMNELALYTSTFELVRLRNTYFLETHSSLWFLYSGNEYRPKMMSSNRLSKT